jgi:hypothetical protein
MNRFVLFMDVLGFSEMVQTNTESNIKQIYDSEFRQTASVTTCLSQSIFGRALSLSSIETVGNKFNDIRQNEINLHLMSDSLIAWTDDASMESFIIISQFAATYSAVSLMLGLPLRGAISVGELQLIELPFNGNNSRNVVGTGLIRAHQLEGCLNWSGVLIDGRCIEELGVSRAAVLQRSDLPVFEYDLSGLDRRENSGCGLVVDWPYCLTKIMQKHENSYIASQFSRHNKRIDNEGVQRKIVNTQNFFDSRRNAGIQAKN